MTTNAERLFARWGHRKWYFAHINWLHRVTYWKRRERREIFRVLDQLKPGKILDYGCNNGFFSSRVREHTGAEVYATDINLSALAEAARNYPAVKFIPLETAAGMCAGFDVILLSHVLEHVEDCDRIIAELTALLAPGGRILVVVPQERLRGDVTWHHLVFYSLKQRRFVNPHLRIVRRRWLEELLGRHGLRIEDHVYINFLPPPVSRTFYWLHAFSLIVVSGRDTTTAGGHPS